MLLSTRATYRLAWNQAVRHVCQPRTVMLIAGLFLFAVSGCSRNFWRTQADFDTYNELLKKTADPRWDLPRLTTEADPRSRLYDPYQPDRPPLPPDDPAAGIYMERVIGYSGYQSWHKFGESMSVENPQWLDRFDVLPEEIPGQYSREGPKIDIRSPYSRDVSAIMGPDSLWTVARVRPSAQAHHALADSPHDEAPSAGIVLASAAETSQSPARITPAGNQAAPLDPDAVPDELTDPALPPSPDPLFPKQAGPGQPVPTPNPVTGRLVPTIENLTLPQAIELANINSREYQTQIENVYLSALQLTFDQFQFNVRYLGTGLRKPGGSVNYLNRPSVNDSVALNGNFGVSQLLPTGGQWIAELTNNTLWIFSSPNQTNSASILSYSIVQPLLLGAGRKVVLETLTRSEREVLYDIRTLARFRKIFFGDTVVNGPGGGYLGLLRQFQQVSNQRDNIQSIIVQLERSRALASPPPKLTTEPLENWPAGLTIPPELVRQFEYDPQNKELIWRGPISPEEIIILEGLSKSPEWAQAVRNLIATLQQEIINLEVAQLVPRLATSQNNLRSLERSYYDNIDQFKATLGLPTDFQLTIDKSLLKQFELIDPRLTNIEQTVVRFVNDLAILDPDFPAADLQAQALPAFLELVEQVRQEGFAILEEDFARVAANQPQRLARLPDEISRQLVLKNMERDRRTFAGLKDDFAAIEQATIDLIQMGDAAETREKWNQFVNRLKVTHEDLLQVTQGLKVVQVGQRVELITLTEFELGFDEVVQYAVENRLDLMNARARVMDARRAMEVAANRLQGVLNIVASGQAGTAPGNKPLAFRADRSTYQVGVQVTAPLDQIAERNVYRETQIDYQRAKRAYMQLEDQVKFDVRAAWRQLNVLRQNFETARQNLRSSAIQLDLAIESANAPVAAAQAGNAGRTTGGGANQGLNLLNALQSVLNAQNDLINFWVEYERNRINIHRDMDTMQVSEDGLWDDPVYRSMAAETPSFLPSPDFPPSAHLPPSEPRATVLNSAISIADQSFLIEDLPDPDRSAANFISGYQPPRLSDDNSPDDNFAIDWTGEPATSRPNSQIAEPSATIPVEPAVDRPADNRGVGRGGLVRLSGARR